MRRSPLVVALLLGLLVLAGASLDLDDDEDENRGDTSDQNVASVVLEHDLKGNGEWTPRGKLTYTGPKMVTSKSKRLVSVRVEQVELTSDQAQQFQALIDGGRQYRVRMQSNVNDPNSAKVSASIPACMLAAAKFHEIYRVHVDQYGHIRGLWYQTLATECPPEAVKLAAEPVQLVTSVSVDMEGRGPRLAVEPKAKSPEQTIEEEKAKPQQTFFQKYWMYIIGGVVLVSLLQGEDDKGPVQRAPHGAKAAEVYGIVGYLLSMAFFIMWMVWAYTPDSVFHSLGITYYPNRYWAAAVPIYLWTFLVFFIVLYNARNLINNKPFESYHTIRDHLEEDEERDHAQPFDQTWTIPPAADIPITTVNRVLFGEPNKSL